MPLLVAAKLASDHGARCSGGLCLEPLGLTVTDAARALGVSRKTLSAALNGRAGISPEMAVRLSIALARRVVPPGAGL